MEKMQTRERKPSNARSYSPPRSQIPTKKSNKKKSAPKKPPQKKAEVNIEKAQTSPKTKKDSDNNIKIIELKNDSKKEIGNQSPKNSNKKKSSSKTSLEMQDSLKTIIPKDLWNSWSNIRQASYKQIFNNPNSFFYRNRLPGDPQKFGAFTAAEEKQFIERLKYFREELGINDGLWGYFSVPILGRVGYQCSNFYRSLILSGKVEDSSYELMPDGKLRYLFGGTKIGGNKPPQKVMRILEEEALAFIKKCFDNAKEEGETPRVLKPIIVKQEKTETEKESKLDDGNESDQDEIIIQIGKNEDAQPNKKDFLIHFNTSAISHGRKRSVFSDNKDDESSSRGRKNKKSRFYDKSMIKSKGPLGNERNRSSYDYSYSTDYSKPYHCPIIGAIDPISKLPMDRPMMDPMGVVMDRSSWKNIFKTKSLPPFEIAAFTMGDLIELKPDNYEEYRYYITNFVC